MNNFLENNTEVIDSGIRVIKGIRNFDETDLRLMFNKGKFHKASDNYQVITTAEALQPLFDDGWFVTQVVKSNVRKQEKLGFQKHMIRMSHENLMRQGTDYRPEALIYNSHDLSSAYKVMLGIWRMICSNGMVVQDKDYGQISIRHMDEAPSQIQKITSEYMTNFKILAEKIENWSKVEIPIEKQLELAQTAVELRWENNKTKPKPEGLLQITRPQDQGDDLWKTFNRIQENTLKGEYYTQTERMTNKRNRMKLKPIQNIQRNIHINQGLWEKADEIYERVA